MLATADSEALAGSWLARRLRAVVYTLAFTGAHKAEVLGLRLADVDLSRETIAFRSHPKRRLKRAARAAVLPIARPGPRSWPVSARGPRAIPARELFSPTNSAPARGCPAPGPSALGLHPGPR